MAPRILIFSNAMGADYAFYVKTIETHACAFLALNVLAIGRVTSVAQKFYKRLLDFCQQYVI